MFERLSAAWKAANVMAKLGEGARKAGIDLQPAFLKLVDGLVARMSGSAEPQQVEQLETRIAELSQALNVLQRKQRTETAAQISDLLKKLVEMP